MDLQMHYNGINIYHSPTQKARILTESWVKKNLYCPNCGNNNLVHLKNNSPVADFYCECCHNEYELKSKNGQFNGKVNDGAYETMISRITSIQNPNFLFMNYQKELMIVENLVVVPKYFFVPSMIEKRKPLSDTAQRAGWIGCNILLNTIPKQGFIKIIDNGEVIAKDKVISKMLKISNLKILNIDCRGWLFDVLQCVNSITKEEFTLDEIYQYELILKRKHPRNNNIKAKIRQQLQYLRDKGFLEFSQRGRYKKII